ncbi:hypothetical protein D3C81_1514940 [compost metagenome]
MRRRCQLQPLGDEQELQAKQTAGQQPATPGAPHLPPATAPADHQTDQHGRKAVAQCSLHHRRNINRRRLDQYLLATPDQAQPQHDLKGKGIGVLAGRTHERPSLVNDGMGKARQ